MTAQLENGYTRIANEILDHIAQVKLNGSQFRIVMAVMRYTYGFNRKEHPMSTSFLAEVTGLSKRHVQRELSALISSRVIRVFKDATFSSPASLGFNKYYDQWCLSCHQVSNPSPPPQDVTTPPDRLDTPPGDGSVTTPPDRLDTPPGDGSVITPPDRLDTPPISGALEPPAIEAPKNYPKDNFKDNIKDNFKEIVFSHWKDQNIIIHKKLTPEIAKAIEKSVRDTSLQEVLTSITHYGMMLHDKAYDLCDYAWSLATFLERKRGYKQFMDDGEKWINYQQRKPSRASPTKRETPEEKMARISAELEADEHGQAASG